MDSKKIIATFAVLALLCVPVISMTETDAIDNPLESLDLGEIDLDELTAIDLGGIVNAMVNLHNEGFAIEFGEDGDANIEQIKGVEEVRAY